MTVPLSGIADQPHAPGGGLMEKLGITIIEASPERVVATMPVSGNVQPAGVLHGGAHCVLGESLGSLAASLHAGTGYRAFGIELNATHHRSVSTGQVTAIATALSLGRTLCSHEVVVRDEAGRRLSTIRITNIIRSDAPTQPSASLENRRQNTLPSVAELSSVSTTTTDTNMGVN